MTFATIFGFIYSLMKAIPVLNSWVRAFFLYYAKLEVKWFENEVMAAMKKAIETGETRDLENTIGSPRAGKPSGSTDSDFSDPDSN